MRTSSILLSLCVLFGCAGQMGSDPRRDAVQAALDRDDTANYENVEVGLRCRYPPAPGFAPDPAAYRGVPGAHVGPLKVELVTDLGRLVKENCRTIRWDSVAPQKSNSINGTMPLAVGRYVLGKIGPEQQMFGITEAPIEATFEPTPAGAALIQKQIILPRYPLHSWATFSKDVDGKLQASIHFG